MGVVALVSAIGCMILVRIVGKRPLLMISSFGVACSSLTLGVYLVDPLYLASLAILLIILCLYSYLGLYENRSEMEFVR